MSKDPYQTRVKDVMSKGVVSARSGDTVHEALVLMDENRVHALPVVDHRDRCIGMFSSTDILELTREIEGELGDLDRLSEESRLGLSDLVSRHSLGQQTIGELMSDDVASVGPDSTLVEASQKMLRYHVHRLPVVDEQQKLLGIVSTMDVLKAFVGGAP